MRSWLLAGGAALAMMGQASAADLGAPRGPVDAVVAVPAFGWTGFYLGGHVGYGWGRTAVTAVSGTQSLSLDPRGVFGGVQLGYNWQINTIVLGVETDISAAGFRASQACPNPEFTCVARSNWVGTLRARAGVAVDRALFYVTGGLAYGDTRLGAEGGNAFVSGVVTTRTRVGYALGAGVEYAFTPNWTAKLEYVYYNLGSATYQVDTLPTFVRGRFDNHTVKLGVNYLFSTGPSAVVAARY